MGTGHEETTMGCDWIFNFIISFIQPASAYRADFQQCKHVIYVIYPYREGKENFNFNFRDVKKHKSNWGWLDSHRDIKIDFPMKNS